MGLGNLLGRAASAVGLGKVVNGAELAAVVAAGALVGSASGAFGDDEKAQLLRSLGKVESLADFAPSEKMRAVEAATAVLAAGMFSGRMELTERVFKFADDATVALRIFTTSLDVAHADGTCDEKEKEVLRELAAGLRVPLQPKYGLGT